MRIIVKCRAYLLLHIHLPTLRISCTFKVINIHVSTTSPEHTLSPLIICAHDGGGNGNAINTMTTRDDDDEDDYR